VVLRVGWIGLLLLSLALPVRAQDNDAPKVVDINYNQEVKDTITNVAIFDWWRVQAGPGDQMVVEMSAADGLAPLLGILNAGGELVRRSLDGAPNGTVKLEYTTPNPGQYTIVATRVGNANGATTGSYTLRLRRANEPAVRDDTYQDVTFRCDKDEATTAATIKFGDDLRKDLNYRITVYGIDGFSPVIRVYIGKRPDFKACSTDARRTVGDSFSLPGEASRTLPADPTGQAAQLNLVGGEEMGLVTLTIGSKDGKPGRYLAVIEGFTIDPANELDVLEARIGPLAAKSTALLVYMAATANSRLDPLMNAPVSAQTCDDAGRRACADVPTLVGARVVLNEGGRVTTISGTRGDAGLLLKPGNPDPISLELGSRAGSTHGAYAIWVIGELPPRG
jgi:hypothetical protein